MCTWRFHACLYKIYLPARNFGNEGSEYAFPSPVSPPPKKTRVAKAWPSRIRQRLKACCCLDKMFQQIDQGYLQHKLQFQKETGRIQAWFPELVLQHSSEKNPAMILLSICFSLLSELHSSIKALIVSLFSYLIVVPTFFHCSILVYIQRRLLSARRTFADFARTLALRYNQIFGTSSLPPPSCMLPAIV